MSRTSAIFLLLCSSCFATNYTVKSGGGGSFTTMAACASQMSTNGTGVSDTCTVFAGTYNETVTIPSGSTGNYKIFNVNGTDIVSVLGFVAGSHTQIIGNCPIPAATGPVLTATCGFFISNTASPNSAACVAVGSSSDVYIRGNTMYACGSGAMITSTASTNTYIQGNTMSYACITQAQAGGANKECNGVNLLGSYTLIEYNDMSHYTLGIDINLAHGIYRNNVMHGQRETEAGGNAHTDWWFAEPGNTANPTEFNLLEGNTQYDGQGANSKGVLAQADTACGSVCDHLIERYNSSSRIGSAYNSNNGTATWGYLKIYNNTIVDAGQDCNCISLQGDIDNSEKTTHGSFLNQLYFQGGPSNLTGFNFYACSNNSTNPPATALCSSGYSLYFCSTITCTTVYGQTYEAGTWLGETNNQVADPKFVNYSGVGNAANNYNLQATSPAIAAGTWLTTANGSGTSSTSLVMTDIAYFQDGFGLSNAYSTVRGDCIAVTTVTNTVCITAVNYSTNTATLSSPISWTSGDHIWLFSKSDGTRVLTGAAPDLGAFPFTTTVNSGGQGFTISNGAVN